MKLRLPSEIPPTEAEVFAANMPVLAAMLDIVAIKMGGEGVYSIKAKTFTKQMYDENVDYCLLLEITGPCGFRKTAVYMRSENELNRSAWKQLEGDVLLDLALGGITLNHDRNPQNNATT